MKKYMVLVLLAAVVSLQGMEKGQKKKLALSVGAFTCQSNSGHQEGRFMIPTSPTSVLDYFPVSIKKWINGCVAKDEGEVLCAIFGGHGNDKVSEHLKQNVPTYFKTAQGATIEEKLKNTCKTANETILGLLQNKESNPNNKSPSGGSTAIIACVDVKNHKLYFANVGDSRGILVRGGVVIHQTKDHKASDPEIFIETLQEGDDVILGSDGVTDCLSSEEIANLVNDAYKGGNERFEKELTNSSRQGYEKLSYIAETVIRKARDVFGQKEVEAVKGLAQSNKLQNMRAEMPRPVNLTMVIMKCLSSQQLDADKNFYADESGTKSTWSGAKPMKSCIKAIKKIGWIKGIAALAIISGLTYCLKYLR